MNVFTLVNKILRLNENKNNTTFKKSEITHRLYELHFIIRTINLHEKNIIVLFYFRKSVVY